MSDALRLKGITRTFEQGTRKIEVLRGVDLNIAAGETVALVAPSGAGKSTLLHIAGLLDTASGGTVSIGDRDLSALGDDDRTAARREFLGFVYQFHHLLPEFSALENVTIPQLAAGVSKVSALKRSTELLGKVGLGDRAGHRPAELSGGEQQRVAICRALANNPKVLLADEPTGNLDPETAGRVFDMLIGVVRDTGLAALIATHNHDLAARMDRIVRLDAGRVAA